MGLENMCFKKFSPFILIDEFRYILFVIASKYTIIISQERFCTVLVSPHNTHDLLPNTTTNVFPETVCNM